MAAADDDGIRGDEGGTVGGTGPLGVLILDVFVLAVETIEFRSRHPLLDESERARWHHLLDIDGVLSKEIVSDRRRIEVRGHARLDVVSPLGEQLQVEARGVLLVADQLHITGPARNLIDSALN